jgi:hypothetical protein
LVAGRGRVVVEFFDDGVSRQVAWPDRPPAAPLLTAVAGAHRGFAAVVVGDYELTDVDAHHGGGDPGRPALHRRPVLRGPSQRYRAAAGHELLTVR